MAVPQFTVTEDNGETPVGTIDPVDIINEKETAKEDSKTTRRPTRRAPKMDPTPKKVGRPSKSDLEKEVASELEALLQLLSYTWSRFDLECAPVLSQQSKDIGESLAAILAKNPKLLEKFRDMTGFGDYLKLMLAIGPVVKAVSKHHLEPGMKKKAEQNA